MPANSLWGRGSTAGPPEAIDSSKFASLVDGVVPSSQLPSYVDDVLEFATLANFPATGETGKIYIATNTNVTYRWSGSTYVEISASLALGTTSTTAYRGDFGNTAYVHSQTIGNPHNTVINLTTDVTGSLPAANGGVTSTTQAITGIKTFTSVPRIQGIAPGFWLDETDDTQKGGCLLIDGGFFQLQRRGTNFGGFEATLVQLNLLNGDTTFNSTTQSTSTTTGALQVSGGVGVAGNINVGGTVKWNNKISVVNYNPLNIAANTWFTVGTANGLGVASTYRACLVCLYIQYGDNTNSYGHWQYCGTTTLGVIQWKAGGSKLGNSFRVEAHNGNDFTCTIRLGSSNINRTVEVMFDIAVSTLAPCVLKVDFIFFD